MEEEADVSKAEVLPSGVPSCRRILSFPTSLSCPNGKHSARDHYPEPESPTISLDNHTAMFPQSWSTKNLAEAVLGTSTAKRKRR